LQGGRVIRSEAGSGGHLRASSASPCEGIVTLGDRPAPGTRPHYSRAEMNGMLDYATEDDDAVHVNPSSTGKTELVVSCPDKSGLGLRLARIIFDFGLLIDRGDFSTDGKWCYVVLRVQPDTDTNRGSSAGVSPGTHGNSKGAWGRSPEVASLHAAACSSPDVPPSGCTPDHLPRTLCDSTRHQHGASSAAIPSVHANQSRRRNSSVSLHSHCSSGSSAHSRSGSMTMQPDAQFWSTLKKRLAAECPPAQPELLAYSVPTWMHRKPPGQYNFRTSTADRLGLLHDLTHTLWKLELNVHSATVTTSPDGRAVDEFIVTDNRNELPNESRIMEIRERIREELQDAMAECEAKQAKVSGLPRELSTSVTEEALTKFDWDRVQDHGATSVSVDNITARCHTMIQVHTRDRKGLLYDCLRALQGTDLRLSYGKITTNQGKCDMDLFIQSESKTSLTEEQLEDSDLVNRIKCAIERPLRVEVRAKGSGPDTRTTLLVSSLVEADGIGRPRMLFDVTMALRRRNVHIFKAALTNHDALNGRKEEVHHFVLTDQHGNAILDKAECESMEKGVLAYLVH